ncbi:DUF1835 domain-containing protein [Paenibacillus mucilaginosus]|uniref:DUF1835 domain-containing protein n=1 Tax=Paenibacillus mucilaginosus TaxID=61624 RepID=UPI001F166039|nr:DUF1835 domain-containing protein [Paenibacillus mucilaginosus]MCG7216194.1 DUF1835 domain-containing protein [Paenibacillus mucilaginosus]
MNSSYALRQVIREMSEQEAKSLLSLLFAHDGYSAETHESLKKSLLEMSKKRTEVDYVKIRHIHIALGDSPGGSLKIALKAPEGRKPEHRVLVLRDALPFSVGPLWKLEEEEGREERRRWCMLHINMDDRDEYLLQGEEQFLEMRSRLEGIPESLPVTIWAGSNAHEQAGLRFAVYLLRHKENPVFLMDTTSAYASLHQTDPNYERRRTGEMNPEELRGIWEMKACCRKLSPEQRQSLESEWLELSGRKTGLRIWRDGRIVEVREDYYDSTLTAVVEQLHRERDNQEWIRSARVVGEMIGHLEQDIGDEYVEYRLRHLIYQGVLEIQGVPRGMRYYDVRMKQPLSGLEQRGGTEDDEEYAENL